MTSNRVRLSVSNIHTSVDFLAMKMCMISFLSIQSLDYSPISPVFLIQLDLEFP